MSESYRLKGESETFSEFQPGSDAGSSFKKGGSWKGRSVLEKVLILIAVTAVAALIALSVGLGMALSESKQELKEAKEGSSSSQVSGTTQATSAVPTMPPTTTSTTTTATTTKSTTTMTTMMTTTTPVITNMRIPLALVPELYKVELQPNLYGTDPSTFTFNGSVTIMLYCREDTDNITLHTNLLNYTGDIRVFENGSDVDLYSGFSFDDDRQFIIIETEVLKANKRYRVEIQQFVGPLKSDLHGLYLSQYQRGNETIYLAATQFQPTDARKAFPCFDEPAIKSKFDITLVRKKHMLSLSNMLTIDNEDRDDDWVADIYDRTPTMSAYLLAFVVCDFNYTARNSTNGVLAGNPVSTPEKLHDIVEHVNKLFCVGYPVMLELEETIKPFRSWARPELVYQTPYSVDIGIQMNDYFEEYFNISYPLKKQDQIAIPDFAAGAMENWGLMLYRESRLLYEPGVSSEGNKQSVAAIVSHELAHQWFGNLVTLAWWDDLWLNEGFASYVEYMGVDIVHPDWKMFEQFVVIDLQRVFNTDGLVTSHPVHVPVNTPTEINQVFDSISYAKGASIIRMMRFFLGEDTFRWGLYNYLWNLKYNNAFHDDLYSALRNQSIMQGNKVDVKGIMDTWILQMNYPTVMVNFSVDGHISFSQSRYLQDPNATDPGNYIPPFEYKWEIPFTFTTNTEGKWTQTNEDIIWMHINGSTGSMTNNSRIPPADDTNWVIGNVMQYGYYRVNYNQENWEALIGQLKTNHTVIHAINRAQIINDAWNLARSGDLGMSTALRTIEYLGQERDYVPWSAADDELGFVNRMLKRNALYGSFQKFMKNISEPLLDYTGLNNTGASHLESYIRSTAASLACGYGIKACIDESKALFAMWMTNATNNPIDPGLKTTVYCTAMAEGGQEEFDFGLQQYKDSELAAERSRLLSALACTKEVWLLYRYLEMSIDDSIIRKQDAVGVIVGVSRNTIGKPLAWDFFRANWDFLLNDYGSGFFSFTSLINGLTESFNTEFELMQLQEFMDAHTNLGSGARAFEQAVERTRNNIHWMEDNLPIISDWLTEQGF